MAPVLLRWIPFGAQPVSERWFGAHKTWRGLVVATLFGGMVFAIQKYAYASGFRGFLLIDYAGFPWWSGFFMGAGAILGDLVKSYYKRKNGIPPGEPWIPWDQADFVFGGIIGFFVLYVAPIEVVVMLLVVSPILHLGVNYIGYLLKIRETKF